MQKPTASVSFQVLPKAKNDREMIRIIDAVIGVVKKSGVRYVVGPMETTMEGELDTLLEVVKKAQYLCIKSGGKSVFTNVKILFNPKGVMTIEEKVTKHRLR